jgi:transcriptional regulator with XRE-family HTH domain
MLGVSRLASPPVGKLSGMGNFSEKLDRVMQERRLSNTYVGEKIGVSDETIRKWRLRPPPFVAQLIALAKILAVPLDYLADDTLDAPPAGPELSEDDRVVLRIAREMGHSAVIRRLTSPLIQGIDPVRGPVPPIQR